MADPTSPGPEVAGLLGAAAPEAPVAEEPLQETEILMSDFDNPELPAEERLAALKAALGL